MVWVLLMAASGIMLSLPVLTAAPVDALPLLAAAMALVDALRAAADRFEPLLVASVPLRLPPEVLT